MSDEELHKTAAEKEAEKGEHELRVGKKGVKDEGEIVATAGGEPIFGKLADITDGD
jgi:hypothetical protein